MTRPSAFVANASSAPEKERPAPERSPGARLNDAARTNQRRRKGDLPVGTSATRFKGTFLVPGTNLAPSEREVAESFASLVEDFTVGELAQAGNVSKETAKAWKAGRSAPRTATLFALGRSIGRIRGWANDEMDPKRATPLSVRAVNNMLAELQQLAMMPGEEGAMARSMLSDFARAAGSGDT